MTNVRGALVVPRVKVGSHWLNTWKELVGGPCFQNMKPIPI